MRSIPNHGTVSEAEQMVQVCVTITPSSQPIEVVAAVVTLATSDGTARGTKLFSCIIFDYKMI